VYLYGVRRLFVLGILIASLRVLSSPQGPMWPSLEQQLARDNVRPGSPLEALIRENQDFGMLRPEEANDRIGIPAWLRVMWRKGHPQDVFSASDPTGGYPRVLKDIHRWMISHQDLQEGPSSFDATDIANGATPILGGNLRISGLQTTPRSESDIKINFFDPTKIISASNAIDTTGTQTMFYSSDGGATWGQTRLSLFTGDTFHSDPGVDWTSDGKAWSLTLGIACTNPPCSKQNLFGRAYSSTDGGVTWSQEGTFSGGSQTNVDKPWLWIDHSLTSPFLNNIYAIYHNGNPGFVNRRTASGWQTPIQVSGAETTGTSIGADIKTNQDGEVFAFWPDTGSSKIYLAKSTNGGASFAAASQVVTTFDSFDIGVPSFASRRALIYTSSAAFKSGSINNVYTSWVDLSGETGCTAPANEPGTNATSTCKTRVWFLRSTDGGTTWSAKKMLNNQPSLNDQYNQAMTVDPVTGALGIIYYDTVADPTRLKTDVWYQSSFDTGLTWSTPVKITTAQTDETTATANSGNQYGDYNAISGFNSIFFPSWTDRRDNLKEEIWTAKIVDRKRRGQITSN
jgi:hypothetical protein